MAELEHHTDPARRHPAGRDEDHAGEADFEATGIHPAPPVGEEIHMPGPSLIPILNALAVTLALLGVTTSLVLLVAGGILFVVTTALWIRDARHEFAELPAEHEHH